MENHYMRERDLESAFWASFVHDIQKQDDSLSAANLVPPDMPGAQGSAPNYENTADDDIKRLVLWNPR
jgi:hypothetical protein